MHGTVSAISTLSSILNYTTMIYTVFCCDRMTEFRRIRFVSVERIPSKSFCKLLKGGNLMGDIEKMAGAARLFELMQSGP